MMDLAGRQVPGGPGPVSQTSSSPPAQTSSAGASSLIIDVPIGVTTCEPAIINWSYAGSEGDTLTLAVTDGNVKQTNINPPPPLVIQPLATNLDPGTLNFTWPQVNLTLGYYVIVGSTASFPSVRSDVFLISLGNDTSCLTVPSSTSSSDTSTASTSSPTTSSSSSTTPIPVSTTKKTNIGAIVGGVVGGVLVIAIGIIACLLLRRKKRPSRRSGSGHHPSDSQDPFTRGISTDRHRRGPSDSTFNNIGPAITTAVTANSNEDLYFENEKDGSPGKASHLTSIAQLAYAGAHRASSSSSLNNQTATTRTSIDQAQGSPESRRPHSSLDIADFLRSERSNSAPGAPRPHISPRTAAIVTAELIPLGRSSSGQSRRQSRKPVPHYDASELHTQSSQASLTLGFPSLDTANNLRHKGSSGDVRPVHYLIPDMPQQGQY